MMFRALVFLYFILVTSSVFSKEIPIIVISAGKNPQSYSTVGSHVTVIDSKTIENSSDSFLTDLLSSEAQGLNIFQLGGKGSNAGIQMRGLPKRYSTIYIDGVKMYDPNLIYFVVDTFLAMSNREFDEMKELYSDYKIPFWMNTRAETINEYRAAGLEEMNMLRMNIGIEHGNYDYRRKYLKRNVKDEVQIRAFEIAAEHKYASCANSIIGMPDETRELIFDTINFVRKLPDTIDATGAFIFAPYHGTPLRTLAIEKGYIKEDEICSLSNTSASMLNMPTISKEEISGLAKVFSLYIKFPKERWPEIKIAEKNDDEGNKMMAKLGNEFDKNYRQFSATALDLHD